MLLDVLMLALFYYATFGVVTTNLFASELGFRWVNSLSKTWPWNLIDVIWC